MTTWWERRRWVLEKEEAALQARGFPYSKDEQALARGRMVLRVKISIFGELRELTATYPDSYPYFAPAVFLGGARFQRHHNLEGFLCLLANDAEDWNPGHDTLADLLATQLQRIEAANQQTIAPEDQAGIEEHAGEPLSNFLRYDVPEVLLLPDGTPDAAVQGGQLDVRLHPAAKGKNLAIGEIRAFKDAAGAQLVASSVSNPSFNVPVRGFWVRAESRPNIEQVVPEQVPKVLHDLISGKSQGMRLALANAKRGDLLIGAVIFQDEVSWNVQLDDVVIMKYKITRSGTAKREPEYEAGFVRADRGGERAYLQRAPFLAPLRDKTVLLIGAGNVGSPVAMQLARAGLKHLDIVEPDVLQVGNTVRWALGRRFAGQFKAFALAETIKQDFPLTTAACHVLRIGATAINVDPHNSDEIVRQLATKADLVIDGTVHYRVNHFLTDLCKELHKPYLWLSTTPGAAGGVVGRILPGQTAGCWNCFQRALADNSLPLPADAGGEEVQPGGCTHPTFVGAGVDSDEITVLASRLAVATLCRGEQGGYPDFQWDVAICDLKSDGTPIAPRWSTHPLDVHPNCLACHQHP